MGSGVYVLIVKVLEECEIEVGSLGRIEFEEGYYAYVGRAMAGLQKRIERHLRRPRRVRWHIDWLTSNPIVKPLCAIFGETQNPRLEDELAEVLSGEPIPRFGSSDARASSHLKYLGTDLTTARRESEYAILKLGMKPRYREATKSVIMDLDGTLCDYDRKRLQAVMNLAKRWGIDPEALVESYESVRREIYAEMPESPEKYSKKRVFERLRKRFPQVPPPAQAEEEFWEESIRLVEPYPDAFTVFNLAERGFKLILLSDGSSRWQRAKLEKIGLGTTFDVVITSEELGINKVSPAAYVRALDILQIQPHDAVVVGDLLRSDVLSPQSVGLRGILLARHGSPHEPVGAPVLTSLTQLQDVLVKV